MTACMVKGRGGLPCLGNPAGEDTEEVEIAGTGLLDHGRGKDGSGRGFIPGEGREVVPYDLFVIRGRGLTGYDKVGGPIAGAVGGEGFVDPNEVAVFIEAKFEFGVGEDKAEGLGMLGGHAIKFEGGLAEFSGKVESDAVGDLIEGNVLVVSVVDFRCGSEDGFGEGIGELDAGGEGDAANVSGGTGFRPGGANEVSAGHALYGDDRSFLYDHGPAAEKLPVGGEQVREVVGIVLDEMVG